MKHFTGVDDMLLRAIATYHFLTVSQIVRLFYSSGSLRYVQKLCKSLAEQGYIQPLYELRATPKGSLPKVYRLATKGMRYFAAEGIEIVGKFRPSEAQETGLTLPHTLAVNDFLIAAHLLPRVAPHISLEGMRHERDLKREPVKVTIKTGEKRQKTEKVSVVPDGWLDFHISTQDGIQRSCIVLELDRGTENNIGRFKQKMQALLSYANGPYQERFGTEIITLAIATTKGERRAEEMRRWTQQELEALNQRDEADLFWFCALPETFDPAAVFLTSIWKRPFDDRPLALLDDAI